MILFGCVFYLFLVLGVHMVIFVWLRGSMGEGGRGGEGLGRLFFSFEERENWVERGSWDEFLDVGNLDGGMTKL